MDDGKHLKMNRNDVRMFNSMKQKLFMRHMGRNKVSSRYSSLSHSPVCFICEGRSWFFLTPRREAFLGLVMTLWKKVPSQKKNIGSNEIFLKKISLPHAKNVIFEVLGEFFFWLIFRNFACGDVLTDTPL